MRMADVIIRITMDEASKMDLARMTDEAVSRSLSKAAANITKYAKDIVPVRTGRLRDSIIVSPTLKSVHMIWNPADPDSGYHYAKVVDEGRAGGTIITPKGDYPLHFVYFGKDVYTYRVTQGPMTGARFSDHMRIVVPQFVREAIIAELARIVP